MLRKYVAKRKHYFIAYLLGLISVILMLVALIVDQLSVYGDSVKCGAFAYNGGVKYSSCSSTLDTCKKTETAGILWIVCSCIGMLCCFIAPALLRVKGSMSFVPFIFTVIFYMMAIVVWIADNPLCFEKNLDPKIGNSLILTLCALIFAVGALATGAYPKLCGKK